MDDFEVLQRAIKTIGKNPNKIIRLVGYMCRDNGGMVFYDKPIRRFKLPPNRKALAISFFDLVSNYAPTRLFQSEGPLYEGWWVISVNWSQYD